MTPIYNTHLPIQVPVHVEGIKLRLQYATMTKYLTLTMANIEATVCGIVTVYGYVPEGKSTASHAYDNVLIPFRVLVVIYIIISGYIC